MIALVTGAAGLIGTEACLQLAAAGYEVVGIDNDMRAYFFGKEASTQGNVAKLRAQLGDSYTHMYCDLRDRDKIERIFRAWEPDAIVHTAAQPSHDWAARDPHTDFEVNALGTLNLLQAARVWTCDSPFIHISTSKVYGEHPNELPLQVIDFFGQPGGRFDVPVDHAYWRGIDTTMSVDQTKHSLFGASKLSGDLLAQEYARYFDMPIAVFRPGCLTGGHHKGTEMHGWLSYLMRCAVSRRMYTIYGYDGNQVRCNIHSSDLVRAFLAFIADPCLEGVYNIGGGRSCSASMKEAIAMCESITGEPMRYEYSDQARSGDHKWWISSNDAFEHDYPHWSRHYVTTYPILHEIFEANAEQWIAERAS